MIQSIAIAYASNTAFHNKSKYLDPVPCDTYPSVVRTAKQTSTYRPYFIKLFKCQGADIQGSPATRICAPTTLGGLEPINITVAKDDGSPEALVVYNHTRCEYRCRYDANVCSAYQIWDEDACECRCNTAMKDTCEKDPIRTWEDTSCCVCKENSQCSSNRMNSTTCHCNPLPRCVETGETRAGMASKGVGAGTVVFVAVLELVLVVGVMMVCQRVRQQGKEQIRCRCRESSLGIGMGSESTLDASPCNGKVLDSEEADDDDCMTLHT